MGTINKILTGLVLLTALMILTFGIFFITLDVSGPVYENEIPTLSDGRIVLPTRIVSGVNIPYLRVFEEERNIHIIVDNFGGSAYDTLAIVARLREIRNKGFTITTEAYGYTMSGGAFIFLMGDRRILHDGAMVMFHGAGFTIGNRRVSLRTLHLTGKTLLTEDEQIPLVLFDNHLMNCMYDRTWMSKEEVLDWMYKFDYNFMSSEDALMHGVATEVIN